MFGSLLELVYLFRIQPRKRRIEEDGRTRQMTRYLFTIFGYGELVIVIFLFLDMKGLDNDWRCCTDGTACGPIDYQKMIMI